MTNKDDTQKLYIVDTLVTFRHRYVIRGKELSHAYDEITMKDSGNDKDEFYETSQKFLGETIIDGREISEADFNKMLQEFESGSAGTEFCSYWMGDKLIRDIDYGGK